MATAGTVSFLALSRLCAADSSQPASTSLTTHIQNLPSTSLFHQPKLPRQAQGPIHNLSWAGGECC